MLTEREEWRQNLGTDFEFWDLSALFHHSGHIGYARGALIREVRYQLATHRTFSNPAEMFEVLHEEGGEYIIPGWTDQNCAASLWAHCGWWDKEYKH